MPANHISDDTLKAIIHETWTRDACGGTRVQLERSGDGWLLWCQDSADSPVSYREFVPPHWPADNALHLTNWISNEVEALLAAHHQPLNQLRRIDLPTVDAATYCTR